MTSDEEQPALFTTNARMCGPCLDGIGKECHTPGCAFYLCATPRTDLGTLRSRFEGSGHACAVVTPNIGNETTGPREGTSPALEAARAIPGPDTTQGVSLKRLSKDLELLRTKDFGHDSSTPTSSRSVEHEIVMREVAAKLVFLGEGLRGPCIEFLKPPTAHGEFLLELMRELGRAAGKLDSTPLETEDMLPKCIACGWVVIGPERCPSCRGRVVP